MAPGYPTCREVPHDRRADRLGIPQGADHGHRPRIQNAPYSIRRGNLLSLLEACQGFWSQRGGERDLDGVVVVLHLQRETRFAEHVEHAVVFGQDGASKVSMALAAAASASCP